MHRDVLDDRIEVYWTWLAWVLFLLVTVDLMFFIREAVPPFDRMLAVILEIWLGALFAVGLAVFANNLVVIFFGRSLV